MTPLLEQSFGIPVDASIAWMATLVESTLKCLLLVFCTLGLVTMVRRTSAAFRHLVWLSCLLSFALMPLLLHVVPRVTVEVPRLGATTIDAPPLAFDGQSLQALDERTGAYRSGQSDMGRANGSRPRVGWEQVAVGLAFVWFVGAAVLAGRVARAVLRARRLCRHGEPASRMLTDRVSELASRMGVRRGCPVRHSASVTSPLATGLFRPMLILPPAAERWSPSVLHAVLAHELAHVKRLDCLTGLLAHFICIVHWFNPGIWFVQRRILLEREHAADDVVLTQTTIRPSDYAGLLLNTANGTGVPILTNGPGTAALHNLAACRIQSVLSLQRRRGAPGRIHSSIVTLVSIILMSLVSTPTVRGIPAPPASVPQVYAPQRLSLLRPAQMIVEDRTGRMLGARSMRGDEVFTLLRPEVSFFVRGKVTLAPSKDRILSLSPGGFLAIEIGGEMSCDRIEFVRDQDGMILVCHTTAGRIQAYADSTDRLIRESIAALVETYLIPTPPALQHFFVVEDAVAER